MKNYKKNRIFVFGSNTAGIHGAGSAKAAVDHWGAEYGRGIGPQGNAYAIPTKDGRLNVLDLETIRKYVEDFIVYAKDHPELEFQVVKIGCGLAGFKEYQIAPMFKDAPKNCLLPDGWR
jgi:hypothetical protein